MGAESIAGIVAAIFRSSNLIAGWLFTYLVHSTLWIVAAFAIASIPSLRRRAAWQHTVWMGAMVAGVASTALQLTGFVPSRQSVLRVADGASSALGGIVIGERQRAGEPLQVRVGTVSRRDLAGMGREEVTIDRRVAHFALPAPNAEESVEHPRLIFATHSAPTPERLFLFTRPDARNATAFSRTFVLAAPLSITIVAPILVVAAILVARLLGVRGQLTRLIEESEDGSHSTAGIALQDLATRAEVGRQVSVVISDRVNTPAAISSSRIILPRRMLAEFTIAEQEAVLAHELGHVVRRDTLWLQLALFIEQLAWFQPLNRLARRRLELAAEFAADSWAVRLTNSPLQLARAITHVAGWFAEAPRVRLHAALGAAGSPLLQRVRSLTKSEVSDAAPSSLPLGHAMLLAAALGMTMSALPRVEVGRASDGAFPGRRTVRVEYRA